MFKKVLIAALAMIGAQAIKVDSSSLATVSKGVKGIGSHVSELASDVVA